MHRRLGPRPAPVCSPLLAALLAAAVAGCASTGGAGAAREARAPDEPADSDSGPLTVGGAAADLGESGGPAYSPAGLVAEVATLLSRGRERTAADRVRRFPEVGAEAVWGWGDTPGAPGPTLLFIAGALDGVTGLEPNDGWSLLGASRSITPDTWWTYDRARAAFFERYRAGRFDEARRAAPERSLPDGAPGLARCDAVRLGALAALLGDEPAVAARELSRAVEAAGAGAPAVAPRLDLLRADALRRAGDATGASDAWRGAVRAAIELAEREPPPTDPGLWERIIDRRPSDAEWPSDLAERAAGVIGIEGPFAVDPARDAEAAAWALAATWRLERAESQTALINAKRWEAASAAPLAMARARLVQGLALDALDQTEAANVALLEVTSSDDEATQRDARAAVGVIQLRSGRPDIGVRWLEAAVDGEFDWPGRAGAEGDLGLAYLIAGREAEGRALLASSRRDFARRGDRIEVLRSLRNESAYLERTGDIEGARELARAAADLERFDVTP